VLDTLRFQSELRDPGRLPVPREGAKGLGITARETEMAERLVREMVAPWTPEKYRDEYQAELIAFIRKRARSGKLEDVDAPERPREPQGKVVDIMSLLKKSLERPAAPRAGRFRAARQSA